MLQTKYQITTFICANNHVMIDVIIFLYSSYNFNSMRECFFRILVQYFNEELDNIYIYIYIYSRLASKWACMRGSIKVMAINIVIQKIFFIIFIFSFVFFLYCQMTTWVG